MKLIDSALIYNLNSWKRYIDQNGNFIVDGTENILLVFQTDEAITKGDALILKSNGYIGKAIATIHNKIEYIAYETVNGSSSVTNIKVIPPIHQIVDANTTFDLNNTLPGTKLYLSDTQSGKYSPSLPTTDSSNIVLVGVILTSNQFLFFTNRSILDSKDIIHNNNPSDGQIIQWNATKNKWVFVDIEYNGDIATFTSGYASSGYINIIDYISISNGGDATNFGNDTLGRGYVSATSNGKGDRGIIAGGYNSGNKNVISYITISSPSNAQDFGDLITSIRGLAAASNKSNDRGAFFGGYSSSKMNNIQYITISNKGNAQNAGDLQVARYLAAASGNGTNDIVVIGGSYTNLDNIDYVNITTTNNAQNFGNLTIGRGYISSTSNTLNNRAIFAGGYNGSIRLDVIDYVTIISPTNASNFGNLLEAKSGLAATSNGYNNKALLSGGSNSSTRVTKIETVNISILSDSQNFGDLTVARYLHGATSNAN